MTDEGSRTTLLVRPVLIEWLAFAVGLVLCLHYAWVLDDAYVYFRYVDNWLLLDRGLVYNPGEYAEGFTSPLWLLLLAAVRSLGLGYWLAIRGLSLIVFAVFWYGAVVLNRRFSPANAPSASIPVVFLCLNYSVLCYFSSGVETPLVQLCAVGYGLFFVRPSARLGGFAVAMSPLVRPELALGVVFCLVWLVATRPPSLSRGPGLRLAAAAGALGGGWLAFRIFYYADLFPVTYYLKAVRDPAQGFAYLHDSLVVYGGYGLLALGVALLALRAKSDTDDSRDLTAAPIAMISLAALIAAYVVWIGGDGRHYRYLAFAYCLLVLGFGGLAEWTLLRRLPRRAAILAPALGLLVALAIVSSYPRQLTRHPIDTAAPANFVDQIADAAHHRTHPDLLTLDPWSFEEPLNRRAIYRAWQLSGEGDPPDWFEAHYLCWYHFQHFGRWMIHSYGLTDGVLARVRSPAGPDDRPGHKEQLRAMARDIERVLRWSETLPAPGMYRAAGEAGVAAPWMTDNLEALEVLERKLYGTRTPLESLRLAFRTSDRISVSPGREAVQ